MQYVVELARVLGILKEARSEELIGWAVKYGLAHYPESARAIVGAALRVIEADATKAEAVLDILNDSDAWPKARECGGKLRELLGHLDGGALESALEAVAQCESAGGSGRMGTGLPGQGPAQVGDGVALSLLPFHA